MDYTRRGAFLMNNLIFPGNKRLASIMLYVTDRCNCTCKHCYIWKKNPKQDMPFEMIKQIINNKAVTKSTKIGLEGGEFILHPEYVEILKYFTNNHPNFDLLSNCVKPDELIRAVRIYTPQRLYVSLDGKDPIHNQMRGSKGLHDNVLYVIKELSNKVPISVMFTLTPYNTMEDLRHVIGICKENRIDLRIGIYSDMEYFETTKLFTCNHSSLASLDYEITDIPMEVKDFPENYDFMLLYHNFRRNKLQLTCNSIRDSIVVYPNGDIPICQQQQIILGNLNNESLDQIINKDSTIKCHQLHRNCNKCWINFHRKYDVVLYRNMEKFLPKKIVEFCMGNYSWDADSKKNYKNLFPGN